jgi:hypothetical protein
MQIKEDSIPKWQKQWAAPSDSRVLVRLKKENSPMTLPHVLKRIRLHLARSKEFPSGSADHGYEFVAPLDHKGHIDPQLWQKYRQHCRVRRFWNGADEQIGRLVHKPGGAEHARWVFDYDPSRTDDDESGYRFGVHAFSPGEYVSISGDDGEPHTFQVKSVEPAT